MPQKIKKEQPFEWAPLSLKQKVVMTWWMEDTPHYDRDMIIAEGAIRSGKTVSMIKSFLDWSLDTYRHESFIIAGKSMGALKRNVLGPMFKILAAMKVAYRYNKSENTIKIGTNTYYLFGAPNDSSQDVMQGLTAAGAYADEVALLPKSFVDQMIARCSVEGSRYFMNCNPEGPYHWFKQEFIDDAERKNAVVLHFDMDDNLTLSEKKKASYRNMYSGVFYKRFILGLWTMAEGVIYSMFDPARHIVEDVDRYYSQYYCSIDYGTKNPTAFGMWGYSGGIWYKIKEYHYDGRDTGIQKTDAQYSRDLKKFLGGKYMDIIIDPSAASFKAQLYEDGFSVIDADNSVIDGIRNVATALSEGLIRYVESCKETFREFDSYVWDEKRAKKGEDKPIKENDHHMDADRYFIQTIVYGQMGYVSGYNAY